jgi:hypothetical protein
MLVYNELESVKTIFKAERGFHEIGCESVPRCKKSTLNFY